MREFREWLTGRREMASMRLSEHQRKGHGFNFQGSDKDVSDGFTFTHKPKPKSIKFEGVDIPLLWVEKYVAEQAKKKYTEFLAALEEGEP